MVHIIWTLLFGPYNMAFVTKYLGKNDSEIKLHGSFRHKHIVEFIDSFESKFVM